MSIVRPQQSLERGRVTNPVIGTRPGRVRGRSAAGIVSFKGIPYARPPFGADRFRPPHPVEPWSGVRDALAFGPKSPQPTYPPQVAQLIPPEVGGSGEDCLRLNLWTPELGSAGRPVMVWIPGGMFGYHATGSSPWYDGSSFARDGVVCVTINYRVGADGFLSLGEGGANRGLLDQVAALAWVRDNIAGFGGDPDNVTIFGESAGAMSVGTLLGMPRADGLFRRAIAQSGAAHHAISAATAGLVAQRLADRLGVSATRDAMAAVPLDRLLAAQPALEADLGTHPDPARWGPEVALAMMPWQPVIDGDTLPESPLARVAAGGAADVDLLVGTNLDEHRLFLVSVGAIDGVTPEALARLAAAYWLPVEPALAAYRAARPDATPGDLLAAIQTDWFWRIPAIRLADAHATGRASTRMYEFAWRSPALGGRLGACHALEIPFVFDTLGNGTESLLGVDPPQPLADAMHAAWVAFATNGDAGWPTYDVGRRATKRFGGRSEVVDDPRVVERGLWQGLR
jgi:para-nitrobenzyl esterase